MVKFRITKPKAAPKPPTQPIPKGIKKGDEVLYMLQRTSYHHMILVRAIKISPAKKYEKFLLDLFKSDKIRMTRKLITPNPFTRMQVKFGITKNLPQRLEDINEDIFDSGVTEWRAISWVGYLIALFYFWWFLNSGKVYLGVLALVGGAILYLRFFV